MKLVKALELAEECGLTTVMEACRNIQIHADQLFTYERMNYEYHALLDEWYDIKGEGNDFDWNSPVTEVLAWLREREK